MTQNEKNFVRAFIDFDSNLMNAQAYIKEKFGFYPHTREYNYFYKRRFYGWD